MPSPQFSISFSAPLAGTVGNGGVATVLIPDATTGLYVVATTANRAGRRSTGIALDDFTGGQAVNIQQAGQVDALTAGLGPGSASYVRVSATGQLERAAVSGSDDVVGFVETDGTLHVLFGILTAAMVNGGGGGATLPIDLTTGVTGILPAANGGTGAGALPAGGIAGVTAMNSGDAASVATAGTNAAAAITAERTAARALSGITSLTTGGIVQSGTTLNATAGGTVNNCTLGGNRRIRFTNASGPTVTGFDATGVADGTILAVYAAAGVVAITHEDALSTAANRCTLQGGTTINVPIGCVTYFTYLTDGTNSRWRHTGATAI